jgi:ferredoxin-NADP reductase
MASILTLRSKSSLGGNVWAFTFEPDVPLNWNAGQAIRVELPHTMPDTAGTKRYFTITSAPFEQMVTIATRLTGSTFKRALAALPERGQLKLLDQPAGTFTWPQDSTRRIVLVAQGVGITPFVSLLRQRHHDQASLAATLVHASLTPPAPFRTEIARLAATHPELITHFDTQPTTAKRLLTLVPDLSTANVLVSGPRPLFDLLSAPVNLPVSRHQYDQFTGYAAAAY